MTALQAQYHAYNTRYFDSSLPADMSVKWSHKLGDNMGDWEDDQIRINASLRKFNAAWKLTLLHEMAHQATATERAEHGPRFRRVMRHLYRLGAFEDLL